MGAGLHAGSPEPSTFVGGVEWAPGYAPADLPPSFLAQFMVMKMEAGCTWAAPVPSSWSWLAEDKATR
jgi:hypothetical protein